MNVLFPETMHWFCTLDPKTSVTFSEALTSNINTHCTPSKSPIDPPKLWDTWLRCRCHYLYMLNSVFFNWNLVCAYVRQCWCGSDRDLHCSGPSAAAAGHQGHAGYLWCCLWPPTPPITYGADWGGTTLTAGNSESFSVRLHHRLYIKIDDTSPFPPTVHKWSQNIPDTGAAILRWWRHLGPESAQLSGVQLSRPYTRPTRSVINN